MGPSVIRQARKDIQFLRSPRIIGFTTGKFLQSRIHANMFWAFQYFQVRQRWNDLGTRHLNRIYLVMSNLFSANRSCLLHHRSLVWGTVAGTAAVFFDKSERPSHSHPQEAKKVAGARLN